MSHESAGARSGEEAMEIAQTPANVVNRSAESIFKLIALGDGSFRQQYNGKILDDDRTVVDNSDPKVAEHYRAEVSLSHDRFRPTTYTYEFTVNWFANADRRDSLYSLQYNLVLDNGHAVCTMIEPDLKTELLKTGATPDWLKRPMEEADHKNMQQLAEEIYKLEKAKEN